jgi:toxin FitB
VIILDTNVLSALMRSMPDSKVAAWLDRQPAQSIWITAITVFEVRFGISRLKPSPRRREIEKAFVEVLRQDLEGRVLDFDETAAETVARLAAERQQAGRPVDFRDTQIAGIALARRATIATRNTRHFADLSVPVVNPWRPDGEEKRATARANMIDALLTRPVKLADSTLDEQRHPGKDRPVGDDRPRRPQAIYRSE